MARRRAQMNRFPEASMKKDRLWTAEHVSDGHPDKFCDQVADAILDEALRLAEDPAQRRSIRTGIECLAKDSLLVISGEANFPKHVASNLNVTEVAKDVWQAVGYGDVDKLTVINHIRPQSIDIAKGGGAGTDFGGAGDQGIMCGYATRETEQMLPLEYVLAQQMCLELKGLRLDEKLPWLKSDCKTQVTLDGRRRVHSVVVAVQHDSEVSSTEVHEHILNDAVSPVLSRYDVAEPEQIVINGTGRFSIGGPTGDAGTVGRKIVVDAYGPRVPVGGGAFSGKDPTKVDRSAAYMARLIARRIVAEEIEGAQECLVTLAYAIGQLEPEMISAITQDGEDVSGWVKSNFPSLAPPVIQERLGLYETEGWNYRETAAFGHYGRKQFPWELLH